MEKALRQRRTGLEVNWRRAALLRAGPLLLAASLLLPTAPISWHDVSSAPLTRTEADTAPADDLDDDSARVTEQTAARPHDGASSVRPRGREAPVNLRQVSEPEPTPAAVGADPDPGDGPPLERSNRANAENRQAARQAAKSENLRVWPMPADSYSFTQAFGCVPQIAHFYQPGAGCPADRPVIHTGIDLAAPEGTPFYAAASGWVTEAGYDREVGVANTRIIIQHEGRNDGFATEYLHWIATFVEVGDHVDAGQVIGEVGSVGYSTGPHLHFSLIDLDSGEHLDPTRWLPQEPGTEGYRGVTPRRAAMRLPAGTTAGVPEYTDPSPPELPERADLPAEAATEAGARDKQSRNKKKKQKQREERRAERAAGKESTSSTSEVSGRDGVTAENSTRQEKKQTKRERKRERNRDGRAESRDASGEDAAGSRKERRKSSADADSTKADKRAARKEKREERNSVKQTDSGGKGNKGNNKNNGGGGKNGKNNGGKKSRQQDASEQPSAEVPAPADESQPVEEQAPAETNDGGQTNPGERENPNAGDAGDSGEPSADRQATTDEPRENAGDRQNRKRERNDTQTQDSTEEP